MTTNIMMSLRQWTVSDDDVLRSISDNEADSAVALALDDMTVMNLQLTDWNVRDLVNNILYVDFIGLSPRCEPCPRWRLRLSFT